MGKNEWKTDPTFYGGLISNRLMLCHFLYAANRLTAFLLTINIRCDDILGYWRRQIYKWRGYCLFIKVVLMKGANQFPKVLHC